MFVLEELPVTAEEAKQFLHGKSGSIEAEVFNMCADLIHPPVDESMPEWDMITTADIRRLQDGGEAKDTY